MSDISKQIKIGDTEYTIRPFKGFKFVRAGRIVARVSDQWKDVIKSMAAWTAEYESENMLRISPEMTRQRETFGISDEQFEGKQFVEIPNSPTVEEQLIGVLPAVLDLAETQVMQLLGLIIAPNEELRKQEREGDVNAYLKSLGDQVLYEGDADMILELAETAYEVLQDQFEGKGEKLLPLAKAFFRRGRLQEEKEIQKQKEEAKQTTSQPSSLPSPSSTPGPETPSSGTSPGTSSEPISASSNV